MPANPEYDNRQTLVLFPNDRMRDGINPKTGKSYVDPQWTGTLYDENGQEYWLSVWEKSGAKGDFFTGSYRIKEDKEAPRSATGRMVRKPFGSRRPVANDDDLP